MRNGALIFVPHVVLITLFLAAGGALASERPITKGDFEFLNVADSTMQGFTRFGSMPAINNAGAVALNATGTGFITEGVFKSDKGALTTIASSADHRFDNFGDSVAIDSEGVIGFSCRVTISKDTIIATGDGGPIRIIADANQQGLVGGGFLGISAMNASGEVLFVAFRRGFSSQAIFIGNGGPLTALVDTATNSNFARLGNAAINASGRITFLAVLADDTVGIFAGEAGSTDVADTTNPSFGGFLDPVINSNGTVASAVFLNPNGVELLTSRRKGITPRTDPGSPLFTFVDNVSINDSGHVAFFANESTGGQGIFLEATGADSPVAVIEAGDPLFGSTVTQVDLGRFSLNNRDQIAFRYMLADGRSGVATASLQHGNGR